MEGEAGQVQPMKGGSMVTQSNYTPESENVNKPGDKESNHKQMISLIKSISGQANVLTIPRLYIDILDGDVKAALLLSQIVYWSDKSIRTDGWFWKSYPEWHEELAIPKRTAVRKVELLKDMGLIETQVKRAMGAPTTHYKVNMQAISDLIMSKWENDNANWHDPIVPKWHDGKCQNGTMDSAKTAQSLTETTLTETTSKNTTTTTQESETSEIVTPEEPEPNELSLSSHPVFKTLDHISLNGELTLKELDYWGEKIDAHSKEQVIGFLEWCSEEGFSWSKARVVEEKRNKVESWEVVTDQKATKAPDQERIYCRFVNLVKRKKNWVEVWETSNGEKFDRYVWEKDGYTYKEFRPDGSRVMERYTEFRYPIGRVEEGDEFYDYSIAYTPSAKEVKRSWYTKPDGFKFEEFEDTELTFEEVDALDFSNNDFHKEL